MRSDCFLAIRRRMWTDLSEMARRGQSVLGHGRGMETWKPRSASLRSIKNARGYTGRHSRNTARLTGSLWAVPKGIVNIRMSDRVWHPLFFTLG